MEEGEIDEVKRTKHAEIGKAELLAVSEAFEESSDARHNLLIALACGHRGLNSFLHPGSTAE